MTSKKSDRVSELVKRFEDYQTYWRDIYERGSDDVEFALGNNQWPENIAKARRLDNRPCLTENRILPFVNQVINGIRQSRPSIIPKPVDDGADVQTAEILRGVIRNIETVSNGDSVYDTAARNSVMAGIGWIRVVTDYADYDTFDQEIRLERVQNFKSVFIDPNHKSQDGSDAFDVFVVEDMDKEEFEKAFPKAKSLGFSKKSWGSVDVVRVCEYFYKDYEDTDVVQYSIGDLAGECLIEDMPLGATITRKRPTSVCKIKYCKFTESEILEESEFPGIYLPLVPVYGFEVYSQDKRTFYSLIHQAKDPQMMLNFWRSASTEVFALQPKAPFVGAVGQFNTYAQQWADANIQNFPTLEYDPVVVLGPNGESIPMPPPSRQQPPTPSTAIIQESMSAADAIKASLGMYDASIGNQTNDISGKAIISRQMQGDNATFHFVDNLAVAIRHVGRIFVNLIPIIYSDKRVLRIMGEDGQESMVPINQPVVKEGKTYRKAVNNELSDIIRFDAGKYDVVVEVGASYATKRQEMANAIVELARVKPEILDVAGDLLMKSLDVPGSEEIAKRIRATMPPELLGDDLEAKRVAGLTKALNELQNKLQLTEEALLAKKQDEHFKNTLEAKKVENDTSKLKIDAALADAQIQKILAEISPPADDAVGAISSALMELKQRYEDVEGALHVLLSEEEGEETGEPESPDNQGENYVGTDIGSDGTEHERE